MLDPQIIPAENVEVRAVKKRDDVSPSYFTISQSQWDSKPRIDVVLTDDGTPVEVTKIAIKNPDQSSKFRIKYKAFASDDAVTDYTGGEDKIKVRPEEYKQHYPAILFQVHFF